MPPIRRVVLCGLILTSGMAAQAALESWNRIERPLLRKPLVSLPMELGDWVGRDEPVDPAVIREAQTTECVNRIYQNRRDPSLRLTLWINYSNLGLNMRHSPEKCLPSNGWTKVESLCQEIPVHDGLGKSMRIMRLGYKQGELVQIIGFWYYIFGEGRWERAVRQLPITSRSSHGRTTRGSGLTVEVFCPSENDPEGEALKEFSESLLTALEPIVPKERAEYFIP